MRSNDSGNADSPDDSGESGNQRHPVPESDWGTGGSDPTAVMRLGFELAIVLLDATEAAATQALHRLEDAAADWARDGVPIDTVQHAIHCGVKVSLDRIDPSGGRGRSDPLADRAFLVDILDVLTSTVSRAYVAAIQHRPGW
ncbi:hypothetical protein [Nocardia mexicana]|uniref:RsbT co-antagonist protein RsbRD N-terminal domain-containing protein n=1 Tax=Nocardia mexicana TaxID=279262 RepID=A0A370GJ97_9NOCA|nr:hypothetical protein [Nocardia mexicana]RDI42464.1 hypothetical protein DFR68_1262 [Nocardia mexicana]